MTVYRVQYQTRSKAGGSGLSQGEWQDKQSIVVVKNDGMEAVDMITQTYCNHDLRINRVVPIVDVDMLSKDLQTLVTQERQVNQSTTG